MAILSFEYEDLDTGWTLEETSFEPLNLLVGPSGAGKTRILNALLDLRHAALRGAAEINSVSWRLDVDVAGSRYTWTVRTNGGVNPQDDFMPHDIQDMKDYHSTSFTSEHLRKDGDAIIERTTKYLLFKNQTLPSLKGQNSAIDLLSNEDEIKPLYKSFLQWRPIGMTGEHPLTDIHTIDSAESLRRRLGSDLKHLQENTEWPLLLRLYVLQETHPDIFFQIFEEFQQIFDTLLGLRIASYEDLDINNYLTPELAGRFLTIALQEEGVKGWLPSPLWSAGMQKTLEFLVETALAPTGTVFFIDELENSLGVNCLPEVASSMLRGLDRVQYIATSHHPRVINEIPYRRWKLVTRRGSQVKVLDAEDIPALVKSSSLERFTELINLPEYVEGVA